MKRIVLFLCLVGLFTSCRDKSTLEKKVMNVHDEVMPKLGELNKDKKKLQTILANSTDESVKTTLQEAITSLEKADEGMMDWMAEYKLPSDISSQEVYLKNEMMRITKVKTDMLQSMSNAKLLQEKYK
ncbi:MAG: formate dehydrogenase maturation protein FdhE [Saprospiraceae bacterium]|jgi:formate dehydrogenase maturation protein FdhE